MDTEALPDQTSGWYPRDAAMHPARRISGEHANRPRGPLQEGLRKSRAMPKTKQNASVDGIWSVVLAFRILETLSQGEKAWRVTDLANDLGTSKTRIFRYLQTLINLGYVIQEADTDRY